MKKIFFSILLSFILVASSAQNIHKISIKYDGSFDEISLVTGQENVIINITPQGDIKEWGIEYRSERISDYSRLEKYLGRTEYYSTYDNKAFVGKVKYIGSTPITYYASYESDSLSGKVKTIGNFQIEYYRSFEDPTQRGKIKRLGSNELIYYSSFDNAGVKGKLKSIGFTQINYYSSFDDKAFAGKIKSIGNISYTYYSSFDRQYAGGLKSGAQSVFVNGINFYLKY
jgi:hypothetical protein